MLTELNFFLPLMKYYRVAHRGSDEGGRISFWGERETCGRSLGGVEKVRMKRSPRRHT